MALYPVDVWFLIGRLDVGGAEQTLVDLANALDPDRYRPTVWTIDRPGPLADELSPNVRFKSLHASHKLDLLAVAKFTRAVRFHAPDIIHSFLFFDNLLARVAGTISPKTTVITGVRSVPDDRPKLRELGDRVTMRLSDRIVSNSCAGAEYIVHQGAPPGRVHVVRNGRDIDRFANTDADTAELRSELGIPPKGPVVGTVSRLIIRKGHYDLLSAWPMVLDQYPDANLLIVGEGPERGGIKARARSLDIAETVFLPGEREDVPELLDLMDVFAFPSHFEGLPGALLEAMAAGLPIVATPVDGNSELVTDGESGVFVPVSEPDALAAEIQRLLTDRDIARELGDEALRTAHDNFTLERMVSEFQSLYDSGGGTCAV